MKGPRQVPKLPPRPSSDRSGCPKPLTGAARTVDVIYGDEYVDGGHRFVKGEDGEERAVSSLMGQLLTVQSKRNLRRLMAG